MKLTKELGYIILIAWVLFMTGAIHILISESFAVLYLILFLAFIAFYIHNNLVGKSQQIKINGVSGNTLSSIFKASIWIISFMIITIALSGVLSNYNVAGVDNINSFSGFLKQSASAFIGAQKTPILEKNPIALFFSFSPYVGFVETILAIEMLWFILFYLEKSFRTNLVSDTTKFGILKKWQFWLANLLVGIGAVFLHLTAKGINDFPLILVLIFFMMLGVMAFIRDKNGKREMETAIWAHVLNNGLAMASLLGWMAVILNAVGA